MIKDKMFDKNWKKCVFLFIIIFLLIAVGGAITINYLNDAVTNNHIHSETFTVKDKYYSDGINSDYYLIITDNNKTLSIVDHGDGHGKEMWKNIEPGRTYRFIIKDPAPTDVNKFTHILQVYNDTS